MIMRGHILEVDHGDAYNNAVATCTERTIISHRDIFAARVEGTLAQPGVASELGWKAQAACNMDQSCPVRLKGKAIGNFGLGRLGRRRVFSCARWSGQTQPAKGRRELEERRVGKGWGSNGRLW